MKKEQKQEIISELVVETRAEKEFIFTIIVLFGVEVINNEFINNYNCLKNCDVCSYFKNNECKKVKDDYPLGGCPVAKNLMIYLRGKMKEQKYISAIDEKLEVMNQNDFVSKNMTQKFIEKFPFTYIYELHVIIKLHDLSFSFDGWDYENTEFINDSSYVKTRTKIKHYYYNELDHWLTYMVGRISRGIENYKFNEVGFKFIRKEIGIKDALEGKNDALDIKELKEKLNKHLDSLYNYNNKS